MSITPCQRNKQLQKMIEEYAETLKTSAHTLGAHGLSEQEFYTGGLFRGAIERIRGQFAATMRGKREFVRTVLDHMQNQKFIQEWSSTGEKNRHDYTVTLQSGKISVIELKGCLDGNNTNIFERPHHAQEFIIWSVCTNPGADPRHNAWSGIHTRLSAEIIDRNQRVDGLVVWDMYCGTFARPCPKILENEDRLTQIDGYNLPPPCIYVFPATVPSPRNNPNPAPQPLQDVEFLQSLSACFGGVEDEIGYVDFTVAHDGADTVRTTRISRNNAVIRESNPTPIRRS